MTEVSFMKSYTYLFVALFLLVVAIQPAHSAAVTPNKSFFDTGMRLCNPDADGNCDNGSYALSIVRYGAGGIAAAALALLAFVVFLPVRCCCNGFGGKNASYGVCPSSSDFRSYTRKEVLAAKIAIFIIAIPIVIGVAIGFQANSDVSSSVDSVTSSLVQSGDKILQSLIEVRGVLVTLPYTTGSAAIMDNAISIATDISSNMHSAQDTTNTYDRLRQSLMIIGFAFSLGLVFVGAVCAILNLRLPAFILAMVSLLVLAIIWLSFGIHLVADKFVYDVCVEIDIVTNNSTSNATSVFKTGALADLWKCGENQDLQQLQALVQGAITQTASLTCSTRNTLCYNETNGQGLRNWTCSNTPVCGPSTLETATDAQHMTILDGSVNRTLRECAVLCADANYRNFSSSLVSTVDIYTNYTNVYYSAILPFVSCQLATDVMNSVKGSLCGTLFDSIYGVAVSNIIVGIFYVAFIILMVVGYKRFVNTPGGSGII